MSVFKGSVSAFKGSVSAFKGSVSVFKGSVSVFKGSKLTLSFRHFVKKEDAVFSYVTFIYNFIIIYNRYINL